MMKRIAILMLLVATHLTQGQSHIPFNYVTLVDTPVASLVIGNRWYYNARYIWNNQDQGLYGMVLEVTGFTQDSFAVVQVQKRQVNQITTSVEYWQQYSGDFFTE